LPKSLIKPLSGFIQDNFKIGAGNFSTGGANRICKHVWCSYR